MKIPKIKKVGYPLICFCRLSRMLDYPLICFYSYVVWFNSKIMKAGYPWLISKIKEVCYPLIYFCCLSYMSLSTKFFEQNIPRVFQFHTLFP